jgi:simple sugar transport system ATP-binding protein
MDAAKVTTESLAEMMVGEMPPQPGSQDRKHSTYTLEVNGLSVYGDRKERAVRDLSFSVEGGKIFGIGGVDGNGQTELAEALVGIRKYDGIIELGGKPPQHVGYIPADRHADGLALGMSVTENLLLGRISNWPKRDEAKSWTERLVSNYDVKAADLAQPVSGLSGGNQQKLVVARALDANPDLVVALNPTRGLDVKATRFVHDQLRFAAGRGAVVVLISADVDELSTVADSVRYLNRGAFAEGEGVAAVVGGPA